MKVYLKTNVFDEAIARIRRIFDEFEEVWVSISGGKDSTVVLNLALMVARERGRLPLKVAFFDQEAEYQATIDYVREVMKSPEVEPYWVQAPFKIFNATSREQEWLYCWAEGEEWMREKEDIALKENVWGTDRFKKLFVYFLAKEAAGKKACWLSGVRAEESPARFMGLTSLATYKDITWGKKNSLDPNHYTFYPIYDWSYLDVWKAIHDNGWAYNRIYDYQYQYGIPIREMRVSNLHHETAVHSLFILQEVEPETYEKLTARVKGVDTAGKLGKEDYYIYELPFMFRDWKEYRDYLLENLIDNSEHREKFRQMFERMERKYIPAVKSETVYRAHVQAILANDWHGTKLNNAESRWRLLVRDYKRKVLRDAMAGRETGGGAGQRSVLE